MERTAYGIAAALYVVKYVKIRAGITHAELGETNTSDESKIAGTLLYCCTNTIRPEREWLALRRLKVLDQHLTNRWQ